MIEIARFDYLSNELALLFFFQVGFFVMMMGNLNGRFLRMT